MWTRNVLFALLISTASVFWRATSSFVSGSLSSVNSGHAKVLLGSSLRIGSWRGRHSSVSTNHRSIREARELRSKQRDIPGGPREAHWPLFSDPIAPFKYVNIKGWDDQWHSMDPAAPELKMPAGVQQIPNPSNFTLIPIVVAPHDRWPASTQDGAHDVSGDVSKYATTRGGALRFGPGWFLKNHRPVVAPMDSVPQNFQTYFNGFVKNGKMVVPKSPPSKKSLVSMYGKQVGDSVVRAEVAANRAENEAYEIESKQSARGAMRLKAAWNSHTPHGDVSDSMAAAEAALAASTAGLSDATSASQDLEESQELLAASEQKPKLFHFTP